jgi:soluble lytic murein transglycosylase
MKNIVLKGHYGAKTLGEMLLQALQSKEARSITRYFNTLAIFIVIALIFSNEFSNNPKTDLVDEMPTISSKNYYQFPLVKSSFGKFKVSDIQHYSKAEFRSLVLASVPGRLKLRLGRYIKDTLDLCEKYQVDPFWAISVMWTESHFHFRAKSHVSATGLMQIMPATGEFLSRLLKMPNSKELVYQRITDPKINIEMGVFYLDRLLKIFDGNHVLATAAYNMGPGGVMKRLRLKLPVGVKNQYLDKVRKYYSFVTREFIFENKKLRSELSNTLVVRFPNRGYLYTQYNELDEVFQFVEIPRFGPKFAFLSERQSNKSL